HSNQRYLVYFYLFSSRRRHTRFSRDWSSDVCSSDLKDQADVELYHELIYGESLLSYHAKSGRQNLKADSELDIVPVQPNSNTFRSEERRVGKECRNRLLSNELPKRINDTDDIYTYLQ